MANREITNIVLKVYNEKKGKRGPIRLQTIKWGKHPPVLEKREYWEGDTGEKTGKAIGINAEEFQILLDNAEEIKKLLQ